MTITINQINNGIALLINNDIFQVAEYHHVKPGKGSAFVRIKLRNVKTDSVIERTFRTADKLEDVFVEERPMEFLYASGNDYHFMDHTTFEQMAVSRDDVGAPAKFLLENLEVTGLYYNHQILKIILPNFIVAKIMETEPGIRGDSSRAGTKPAKIETGTTVQVPLFISGDDWIKIDTRTGEYVERVQQ